MATAEGGDGDGEGSSGYDDVGLGEAPAAPIARPVMQPKVVLRVVSKHFMSPRNVSLILRTWLRHVISSELYGQLSTEVEFEQDSLPRRSSRVEFDVYSVRTRNAAVFLGLLPDYDAAQGSASARSCTLREVQLPTDCEPCDILVEWGLWDQVSALPSAPSDLGAFEGAALRLWGRVSKCLELEAGSRDEAAVAERAWCGGRRKPSLPGAPSAAEQGWAWWAEQTCGLQLRTTESSSEHLAHFAVGPGQPPFTLTPAPLVGSPDAVAYSGVRCGFELTLPEGAAALARPLVLPEAIHWPAPQTIKWKGQRCKWADATTAVVELRTSHAAHTAGLVDVPACEGRPAVRAWVVWATAAGLPEGWAAVTREPGGGAGGAAQRRPPVHPRSLASAQRKLEQAQLGVSGSDIFSSISAYQSFRTFSKVRALGRGQSSTVYLLRSRVSGREVAAKEIDTEGRSSHELELIRNEVALMSSLDHPYIIKYGCCFQDGPVLVIVQEYAPRGTLGRTIERMAEQAKLAGSPEPTAFPSARVAGWLSQLVSALQHMHGASILHRDLTCENILVMSRSVVKIGDLGLSRVLSQTQLQTTTFCGTPYSMSPELATGQPYGVESDVWALGVVLFRCLTLERPFKGDNFKQLMQRICAGEYDEQLLERCAHPEPLKRLASKRGIFHQTPAKRTSLDEIAALYPITHGPEDEPPVDIAPSPFGSFRDSPTRSTTQGAASSQGTTSSEGAPSNASTQDGRAARPVAVPFRRTKNVL